MTLAQRILSRVVVIQASATVDTPCWIWQGSLTANGYGQIKYYGRVYRTHRVVWDDRYGPVPAGRELDHSCDVPACCRHDHLAAVTHRENIQRAYAPSRAR